MAVQAQYPSTVLHFDRSEQERNRDMEQQPLFLNHGNSSTRKRGRDGTTIPTQAPQHLQQHPYVNLFSSQQQQQQQPNSSVSIGLCLSFEQHQQPISSTDLDVQFEHQMGEIDRLIRAQGEQLRRMLAEGQRRHLRAVAEAAEADVSRRVREKEAELELAARRNAKLEERVARLAGESAAWQAKAKTEEAAATELRAQLRQVAATRAAAAVEDTAGSDAESSCVDPRRRQQPPFPCRRCVVAPATVVLLPCRHLCLCRACDAATEACPVCSCARSVGVEVYLS